MDSSPSVVTVHTLSNIQTDRYDNKPYNYTNCFNIPLRLENNSKICLSEFEYSSAIIADDTLCELTYYNWLKRRRRSIYYGKKYIRHLGLESFSCGKQVAARLNSIIFSVDDNLRRQCKTIFSFDEEADRLVYNGVNEAYFTLKLRGSLLRLCGADKYPKSNQVIYLGRDKPKLKFTIGKQVYLFAPDFRMVLDSDQVDRNLFQFPVYLHKPIKSLYIYCSLFQPSYIGDDQQPIARIVEFNDEFPARRVCKNYTNAPIFVDITQNSVQSIKVEIKSDTGEYVKFKDFVRLTFTILKS